MFTVGIRILTSVLLLFFCVISRGQQDSLAVRPPSRIAIFNQEEKAYIAHWLQENVQELDLSEIELNGYQEVWATYTPLFDDLGELGPDWSKTKLIQDFNALVEHHFQEMGAVLSPEHFKRYQKEFKNLVWAANIRLQQL